MRYVFHFSVQVTLQKVCILVTI